MKRLLIGIIAAITVGLVGAPIASAFDPSDENDEIFIAELTERGVPTEDPDGMIVAGYGTCGMLMELDNGLIETTAWVMDTQEITGKQPSDVVDVAIDVYCPEAAS